MRFAGISLLAFLGLIAVASTAPGKSPAGNGGKQPPKGGNPPPTSGGNGGSGSGGSGGSSGGGGGSGQQPMTGYPTMDVPPPTNQPWFRSIDLSKVPNIPPRKNLTDCPPIGSPDPNCVWTCTLCTASNDIDTCPKPGDWGFTWDDGPASSETGKLLGILDGTSIKATFFIVGSRVVEFPGTLMRTYKSGHQLGVHTWSHTPLTTQTTEEIVAEMLWTERIIKEVTGVVPKYMRPPYGDIDNRVRAIMDALGYKIVIWNREDNDGLIGSVKFDTNWINSNFTQWVHQLNSSHGDISLEHDIHIQSVSVANQTISILLGAGLKPQPVSQCLGDNQPYQASLSNSTTNLNSGNSTNSPSSSSSNGGTKGSNTTTGAGGDESVSVKSTSDASVVISNVGVSAIALLAALSTYLL